MNCSIWKNVQSLIEPTLINQHLNALSNTDTVASAYVSRTKEWLPWRICLTIFQLTAKDTKSEFVQRHFGTTPEDHKFMVATHKSKTSLD